MGSSGAGRSLNSFRVRGLCAALLGVLMIILLGCSSGKDASGTSTDTNPLDTTPPVATDTSLPRGTGLDALVVRKEDLPDGWSENQVDLSKKTPATGPVCLVDVANPAQVTDASVWEAAPKETYKKKIATTAVQVPPEVADALDQSLSDGTAASCIQQQFTDGFKTEAKTTIAPIETGLDSSYLLTTTASVPASAGQDALDLVQAMAVLREGDTVVILELNSGEGPMDEAFSQGLIDLTAERMAG